MGGEVRKCYRATGEGEAALVDVRGKIAELMAEVLEGHRPGSFEGPSREA